MTDQSKRQHISTSLATLVVVVGATFLLVACGGGSPAAGTTPDPQTPESPQPPVTASSVGECFKWTPGTKYTMSDGSKHLIVQEVFEGENAIGWMELRPDDTRFGGAFVAVDNTHVRMLGTVDYGPGNTISSNEVYSADARFPADMTAGQTVSMSFVATRTYVGGTPAPSTESNTGTFTFVGVENLMLGGRTFTDVCKIRSESNEDGRASMGMLWVAKGFGYIRTEELDAKGAPVPGTRDELATIISAP